ncbi:MAG: hypothetical protein HGA45_27685 [Chloroflexales bacterium]|nr:hypothetical protein [Chloroflexales bacterium]
MEENVGQRQPGLGEGYLAEQIVRFLARNWHYIVIAIAFLGLMFVAARRRARGVRGAPAAA